MTTEQQNENRRRNRWLKPLAALVAAVLTALVAILLFVSLTSSGLRWAVGVAESALGDQLRVERIEGRLAGPLRLEGFLFRYPGGEISLGRLELDWLPQRLFFAELSIETLILEDLRVAGSAPVREAEPETETGAFILDVQLPLDITIASATLVNLEYRDDTQQHRLDRILLSAYTDDNQVYIDTLQVDAGASTASASGQLALTPHAVTGLALEWRIDMPELGELTSTGTLEVNGKPNAYRFSADLDAGSTQLPAGRWHLGGNGTLDGLTLEALRGETLDGVVNASGKLDWQAQLQWDIALELQNVDPGKHWSEWPGRLSARLDSNGRYADGKPDVNARLQRLTGQLREHNFEIDADMAYRESDTQLSLNWTLNPDATDIVATSGQLTVEGTPEAYRYHGKASLQGPQIPAGSWQLAGQGVQQGLTLESLHGEFLGGTVSGNGTVDWQPQVRWEIALDTQRLDPGQHWPEWPGRISGGFTSEGRLADGKPDFSAGLTGLNGELRGYAVTGQAEIALQGSDVTVHALDLRSGDNRLTASGNIHEKIALDWRLAANDLSAVLPDWHGTANLDGKLFGSRSQPGIQARIAVNKLRGPQLALQALSGAIKLQQADSAQQLLELKADELLVQGRRFQRSTLNLSGTLLKHLVSLHTETGKHYADVTAAGGWQRDRWQGRLETAQWDTPETGDWKLDHPVPLTLGQTQLRVPETCWSQAAAKLCIDIDADPAREWRASSRLQALPLAFFNKLLDEPMQWDSEINAALQATGRASELTGGRLQAGINEGTLVYGSAEDPVEVPIKGLDLNAVLDSSGVDAALRLDLAGQDYIDSRLQLPGYRIAASSWQQQELQLGLQGKLDELALVRYLVKDFATFKGRIDIDMNGRGTLGKPLLAGDIRVRDGNLGINMLGIELQEMQVTLSSADDGLNLLGSARSGDGHLTADGKLSFKDIARWNARVDLQGKDFETVHIPEAVVLISPDIRIDIAPAEVRLQGTLHVPSAHFKPKRLSGGVAVSRDVVIIEPEQAPEPAQRWKTYSQLHLSLGDDVRLDGFGVKGNITGQLDLQDEPEGVTRGRGKLAIQKGTYTGYGRELDIVKGNLLFGGGPVDNPGLDLDAERVVGDVHAGIRARGTLKEPKVSLYSDPAMSDADIVSYITLGRPASQAGEGGGGATDALAMATGNLLAGNVSESLGLEELRLESEGSLEEASLVMGTYLSPQLFVRYSAGLYETVSQFEAIYELNRNWSLWTRTSTEESSADIMFTFER